MDEGLLYFLLDAGDSRVSGDEGNTEVLMPSCPSLQYKPSCPQDTLGEVSGGELEEAPIIQEERVSDLLCQ